MTQDEADLDPYEQYAERFDPCFAENRQRAGRKPGKMRRHSADTAEPATPAAGLVTTYHPARYEAQWLESSLRTFYAQELISDVLAQVKGGKEASVYRCAAFPGIAPALLAAKVYRPRQFRNLRNDKVYREGRAILTADGSPVNRSDHRVMRAIGKKTAFGQQVQHTSWIMHEYTTMQRLHAAGLAVPEPIAAGENAILMSYYGDERRAAPTLNEISLAPKLAAPLLDEILLNIELMLQHNLIHGDLSAYNILLWEGRAVLIDFPQITDLVNNSKSAAILQRDITRVCEYFARQGVRRDPAAIMAELWGRYGAAADERQLPTDEVWAEDDERWLMSDQTS